MCAVLIRAGFLNYRTRKSPQAVDILAVAELQRLHYDTVNVTAAPSFAALTKLAPMTQITYGTDFPYFTNDQLDALDQRGVAAKDLAAIHSGNAKRLIPRLAKA